MTVEARYTISKGDYTSKLRINGTGDQLYRLNNGAPYRMNISDTELPATTAFDTKESYFYALTIDPENNDIYLADAIDYQQPGIVYRYSATGKCLVSFYVGVIPTEFCWNK